MIRSKMRQATFQRFSIQLLLLLPDGRAVGKESGCDSEASLRPPVEFPGGSMRRFAAVLKARNSKTTGRMYGSRRDRRGLVEGVATSETGRNQDRGGEYRCVGQQHQLKSVGFFVDPGVYPVHRGTPHNYSPAWQASWHTSAPVHNRCFGLGKPLATSRLEKR